MATTSAAPMDPAVERELSQLEPEVAFRAISSHTHHTWARTFNSRPELYIQPYTLREIQKVVRLARRCRRRIVVVGCGHSPSDLTCTSSWMVNLDNFNDVLHVDKQRKRLTVQGGIRLRDLNAAAAWNGFTMPNLGSIDEQSIVGAISTATHGSSLRYGLMSDSVKSMKVVLGDGSVKACSAEENVDLFRAALTSLGALGIIAEVEFEMVDSANIEWTQELKPLAWVLDRWSKNLWTQHEYVRVWWLPYMKRAIVWSADKTDKPLRKPVASWYAGSVGYHTYHILLWLSNYAPRILPAIEWFVFGMQYGFSDGAVTSAVEPQRSGLLMNCLYSQFVNEWALPLEKGPEAISRLSAWLNHEDGHNIPFSSAGLYVHAPIEVRVSNGSKTPTKSYLDTTAPSGPTLYLNATLYRAFLTDPPCTARYYQAFEWLMKDMGGKPHWAKNFAYTTRDDLHAMYGSDMADFLRVRDESDPDGVFLGAWHRRYLLPADAPRYPCEEREIARTPALNGGRNWFGEGAQARTADEKAALLDSFGRESDDGDDAKSDARTRETSTGGLTGTKVFDKM